MKWPFLLVCLQALRNESDTKKRRGESTKTFNFFSLPGTFPLSVPLEKFLSSLIYHLQQCSKIVSQEALEETQVFFSGVFGGEKEILGEWGSRRFYFSVGWMQSFENLDHFQTLSAPSKVSASERLRSQLTHRMFRKKVDFLIPSPLSLFLSFSFLSFLPLP